MTRLYARPVAPAPGSGPAEEGYRVSESNTQLPVAAPLGAPGPVPCTASINARPAVEERSGTTSMCSCELETEPGPTGPILVLHVAGEIDLVTLPLLRHALAAAVGHRPGDLVVDMAAVDFCCLRGFTLLATAATTAQTNGTGYALSGLSPHLGRFATLLWPEAPFVRYSSTATAVTAIRIDQTYRPT